MAGVRESSGTARHVLAILALLYMPMRYIIEPQSGDEDKVMDTVSLMSAYDNCYQWC